MKTYLISLLIILGLMASPAYAGPGHDHSHDHNHQAISNTLAVQRATEKLLQLVEEEKIDASWSKIHQAQVEQKTYAKGPEWVISFNNPSIEDTSKQTLYIFFSLDGHYIAANYTGQ